MNKLRMQANQQGFTLIELMIVIAIIGILAAVAIPNYISFRDKAYCSGAESDANSVLGTLSDFYAIPSNTVGFTNNLLAGGTTLSPVNQTVLTFKALSNGNTGALATVNGVVTVTIRDVSARCPSDYKIAQSTAGWNNANSTFAKSM